MDKDNLKTYVNKLLEIEKEEEKIKALSANLRKEKEKAEKTMRAKQQRAELLSLKR